ncbi:MAG: VWA domain-containing protein [Alphaproteobacteria bacterium]
MSSAASPPEGHPGSGGAGGPGGPGDNDAGDQAGQIARNFIAFVRALRAAGLAVGPGQMLDAQRAVQAVGLERREDLYWALHAVLVHRRPEHEIFDQAFRVFWRDPGLRDSILALAFGPQGAVDEAGSEAISRRVAEALGLGQATANRVKQVSDQKDSDGPPGHTAEESLNDKDFESMTEAELSAARRAIARLSLDPWQVATRRHQPATRGPIHARASLRASLRAGGDLILFRRRRRRLRPPPIVVVCDISGSMSRYTEMALHFMHAITSDRDRVHSFVFATRLTNISRLLRQRDLEVALDRVATVVTDWEGGTRIGAALADFNRTWSRRVLTQGAMVLFITDGLDREGATGMEREMERLHRSSRRLIWLNPLLRYAAYEPRSTGAAVIARHVDDWQPVHNLKSLEALARYLSRPAPRRFEPRSAALAPELPPDMKAAIP